MNNDHDGNRLQDMPKDAEGLVTTNWSAGLEHDEYETDRDLVISDAIDAVERTASGYTVNLVTAAEWGDPEAYLTPILKEKFGHDLKMKFIDQCGCGGYVLRVWR